MRMNFGEIVRLEPQLGELFYQAMNHHPADALTTWYQEYKPVMSNLVGMSRGVTPILGTSEAYDICYFTIASVLGVYGGQVI